jgi:hypothetical protein
MIMRYYCLTWIKQQKQECRNWTPDFSKKIDEGDLLISSLAEKNGVTVLLSKIFIMGFRLFPVEKHLGTNMLLFWLLCQKEEMGAGPWQNRYSKTGITAQWNSH